MLRAFAFLWGIGFPAMYVFQRDEPPTWWPSFLVALGMAASAFLLSRFMPRIMFSLASGTAIGSAISVVAAPMRGNWMIEGALIIGLAASVLLVAALNERSM